MHEIAIVGFIFFSRESPLIVHCKEGGLICLSGCEKNCLLRKKKYEENAQLCTVAINLEEKYSNSKNNFIKNFMITYYGC